MSEQINPLTKPNNFERLFPNKTTKFLLACYIISCLWWITIFGRNLVDTAENFLFDLPLGLIPIIGGGVAIYKTCQNKNAPKLLRKSIILHSLGLIFWGIGALIWIYYNFVLGILVAYPSIADLFFVFCFPLWFMSLLYLCRATQMNFKLKKLSAKVNLFFLPLIVFIISYYFIFIVARGDAYIVTEFNLKFFLDIYYPLSDILLMGILSLILYGLLFGQLHEHYTKPVIIIILGFICNYIADFLFTYTTNTGTFFVGGVPDLIYLTVMFLLALGVNSFEGLKFVTQDDRNTSPPA